VSDPGDVGRSSDERSAREAGACMCQSQIGEAPQIVVLVFHVEGTRT
jgi:hypothetical protein